MAVRLEVRMQGHDRAVATLQRLRRASRVLPHRILSKMSRRFRNILWEFTPRGKTGQLRESIEVAWGTNWVAVSIGGPKAPYALIVEQGSPRHWMEPRKGRIMTWKKDGEWAISRGHWHPGFVARRYIERAWRYFIERCPRWFGQEIDGIMDIIRGGRFI